MHTKMFKYYTAT